MRSLPDVAILFTAQSPQLLPTYNGIISLRSNGVMNLSILRCPRRVILRIASTQPYDPQPAFVEGNTLADRIVDTNDVNSSHTSRTYGSVKNVPINGSCRRKVKMTGKKSLYTKSVTVPTVRS